VGTRYPTPQRLAWHAAGDTEAECGAVLGRASCILPAFLLAFYRWRASGAFSGHSMLGNGLMDTGSNGISFGILGGKH
jgi:hypothetical protein